MSASVTDSSRHWSSQYPRPCTWSRGYACSCTWSSWYRWYWSSWQSVLLTGGTVPISGASLPRDSAYLPNPPPRTPPRTPPRLGGRVTGARVTTILRSGNMAFTIWATRIAAGVTREPTLGLRELVPPRSGQLAAIFLLPTDSRVCHFKEKVMMNLIFIMISFMIFQNNK